MNDTDLKRDTLWIDFLRVIATFSVIVLHVSAPIVNKFEILDFSIWLTGNFYDSLVRFCVPIFFMISGTLFLSRDIDVKAFLSKRFSRIIPPLLFWSMIYISYSFFIRIVENNETFTFIETLKIIVSLLLSGSSYHLWFVYTICGLYLFIPIIQMWIKFAKEKEILFFLILWLVANLFQIKELVYYLPQIDLINFTGYLGYFVLGYYLVNNNFKKMDSLRLNIMLTIFGTLITFILTSIISWNAEKFIGAFYGYLMPNVVITAIGIFQIARKIKIRNAFLKNLISRISNNSFAIYFIHVLILKIFQQFNITGVTILPIVGIPVISILVFILSYYIILVLRKVPILNKILG